MDFHLKVLGWTETISVAKCVSSHPYESGSLVMTFLVNHWFPFHVLLHFYQDGGGVQQFVFGSKKGQLEADELNKPFFFSLRRKAKTFFFITTILCLIHISLVWNFFHIFWLYFRFCRTRSFPLPVVQWATGRYLDLQDEVLLLLSCVSPKKTRWKTAVCGVWGSHWAVLTSCLLPWWIPQAIDLSSLQELGEFVRYSPALSEAGRQTEDALDRAPAGPVWMCGNGVQHTELRCPRGVRRVSEALGSGAGFLGWKYAGPLRVPGRAG